MNYTVLTRDELLSIAERDPRYGVEPLFTTLVARLRQGWEPLVYGDTGRLQTFDPSARCDKQNP